METKNNKGIIILLIIIIVILSILCILFATKTINFTDNKENNNTINQTIELTQEEAKEIISTRKDIITSFYGNTNTYCGPNGSELSTEITTNGEPYTYYLIKDYNTYNQLKDYLLQFITEEGLSSNQYFKSEYYVENNGKLYCKVLNKSNLNSEYNNINIENIEKDKITATMDNNLSGLGSETKEKVKISVKKEVNNVWKIDSYETITE